MQSFFPVRTLKNQRGFSLSELLVVVAIVLVVLGLALPNLFRAQATAQEGAAAAAMRAIHLGESIYFSQYGYYASSLLSLGPPKPGSKPSPSAADILDANLARGWVRGYSLRYQAIDLDGNGFPDGYVVNADGDPLRGTRRFYYVDETGIIRVELEMPASRNSGAAGSFGNK
ncbi:MAG: prepilin-type N-terminal cleavage/methylation domain-containing protein [Acidobacteria bacterium]|nr:prepilin-type N-terminal cleavage/methylation domain-containing protein [Acidobacteriota bacterium]